jgi:hypothetical protein
MVKTRQVNGIYNESDDESELEPNTLLQASINQVQIRQSPSIDSFNSEHNIRLTIYSGTTGNMIRSSAAKKNWFESNQLLTVNTTSG